MKLKQRKIELKELLEKEEVRNKAFKQLRDGYKVNLWMNVPNPLIDWMSPNRMIEIGRGQKLLRLMDD